MNFLAPLFLLGGLAIAGPVLFHLIRRTTRERTVFSSLMFLLPTPPRLTKRSRLEHWLLLLLRCLALALLALAFARPFFKDSTLNASGSGETKRIVVLVDVSASMRRAGLWADARARAEAAMGKAGALDQVAVYTFGRVAQPLFNFAEWTANAPDSRVAFATARLAQVSPGWSETNLGAALATAAEALADVEGKKSVGPRQIILISDLQAGSHLEAVQGYEWPKGIEVFVEPLKARNPTNAGVQLLTDVADSDRQAAANVRVRVSNASDSTREQFKLGWVRAGSSDFSGAQVDTYVPPGQSRIISLPAASANGAQAIALRGDDEDFDNTAYVIPPAQQRINLTYLGGEKPEDSQQPLFFLKRALPETPRLAVAINAQSADVTLSDTAKNASLFVVTDSLPAAQAAALREQILAGKTLLFAPKSAAAAASIAPVLGVEQLSVEDGRVANYAMFAEIDFQHPLFAAFADPRYSDFTKIHFWKYRRIDPTAIPGARILAKFDQGDPALLEIPAGRGRVLFLTSGWNPEDSQLAVSSKFVPILYSLLEFSGALSVQTSQYFVGDPIPFNAALSDNASVQLPGGRTVNLPAGASTFTETTEPGIYHLTTASGRAQTFAVNLNATESRTAPLPIDELEKLGVPLARSKAAASSEAAQRVALQSSEAESRQKLWRWFLFATLAVLVAESLVAGWTARKNALAASTPSL